MRRKNEPVIVFLLVAAVLAAAGAAGLTLTIMPASSSVSPWIAVWVVGAAWTVALLASIASRRAVRASLSQARIRSGVAPIGGVVAIALAVGLVLGSWLLRKSMDFGGWSDAETERASMSGATLVAGLALAAGVMRRKWLLLPEGRACGSCGHLMAAAQTRCPECGGAVALDRQPG